LTIEEITAGAQLDALIASEERGVVIDFWGTWCQPCRALRPHLEKLADQHDANWKVVAVHVEASEDLIDRFGVQATPTIVYLQGGIEVHRSAGAITPSGVAADLAEHGQDTGYTV